MTKIRFCSFCRLNPVPDDAPPYMVCDMCGTDEIDLLLSLGGPIWAWMVKRVLRGQRAVAAHLVQR